jgi:hypothetical protein
VEILRIKPLPTSLYGLLIKKVTLGVSTIDSKNVLVLNIGELYYYLDHTKLLNILIKSLASATVPPTAQFNFYLLTINFTTDPLNFKSWKQGLAYLKTSMEEMKRWVAKSRMMSLPFEMRECSAEMIDSEWTEIIDIIDIIDYQVTRNKDPSQALGCLADKLADVNPHSISFDHMCTQQAFH